jgi:hypothetical protein
MGNPGATVSQSFPNPVLVCLCRKNSNKIVEMNGIEPSAS